MLSIIYLSSSFCSFTFCRFC